MLAFFKVGIVLGWVDHFFRFLQCVSMSCCDDLHQSNFLGFLLTMIRTTWETKCYLTIATLNWVPLDMIPQAAESAGSETDAQTLPVPIMYRSCHIGLAHSPLRHSDNPKDPSANTSTTHAVCFSACTSESPTVPKIAASARNPGACPR
jgi:hypothetical protein